jgi:hypothetical protein
MHTKPRILVAGLVLSVIALRWSRAQSPQPEVPQTRTLPTAAMSHLHTPLSTRTGLPLGTMVELTGTWKQDAKSIALFLSIDEINRVVVDPPIPYSARRVSGWLERDAPPAPEGETDVEKFMRLNPVAIPSDSSGPDPDDDFSNKFVQKVVPNLGQRLHCRAFESGRFRGVPSEFLEKHLKLDIPFRGGDHQPDMRYHSFMFESELVVLEILQ